jgi:GDP-mannose 6-dehydrogenase
MKISVIGIGYVGAVTSACLAKDGHTVIAVDKDATKIRCVSEGRAPIVEAGLDSLVEQGVKAGRLSATDDLTRAILDTDITLICVGTPSCDDGSLDLTHVIEACGDMGRLLESKDSFHTIVLRSTMLPGSAVNRCLPVIECFSGKKSGQNFGFGNNPEFLREGTAIVDYYNPPKIVVGANDPVSAHTIMSLYDGIEAPRIITDIDIAEGVKYADNSWHAVKVSFANEIGNIMKACGVDSHRVMDIFCMDQKLNISKAYLKPGFAFGGSCLPKDVNALCELARQKDIQTPLLNALIESNNRQVERAFDMIKATGCRKISILGLSFKTGTDDLRGSPLVLLGEKLLNEGYDIKIFDPNVTTLTGSVILERLVTSSEDIKNHGDLFVIGNGGDSFSAIIASIANDDIPVIDLVRLDKTLETRKGYNGICW